MPGDSPPVESKVVGTLAARRTFRLSATVALALVIAYGSGNATAYFAPLLALVLGANPGPPIPPAKLLIVALALAVILGTGLVAAPLVEAYPLIGLCLVAGGLYASSHLALGTDKAAVGTLLAVGLTLVSAVGVISLALAQALIASLIGAVVIAVLSQWVVYPFFPEPNPSAAAKAPLLDDPAMLASRARRVVWIVMPAYLFLLVNPAAHAPVMMKSIVLAQTGASQDAREAAIELLGATVLGGALAVGVWLALQLAPNLWFFGLWMLLVMIWITRHLYLPGGQEPGTGRTPQFWLDTAVTCLILVGPAVADSANGKDPWKGFAVRFGLYTLVSIYAWFSLQWLERLERRASKHQQERVAC